MIRMFKPLCLALQSFAPTQKTNKCLIVVNTSNKFSRISWKTNWTQLQELNNTFFRNPLTNPSRIFSAQKVAKKNPTLRRKRRNAVMCESSFRGPGNQVLKEKMLGWWRLRVSFFRGKKWRWLENPLAKSVHLEIVHVLTLSSYFTGPECCRIGCFVHSFGSRVD